MSKNFTQWKQDKQYFKKKQEKRERVIFIISCIVLVLGVKTGSYIFNSSPVAIIESNIKTVEAEKDSRYVPEGFLSYEAYERSFKESNRHLYD